MFRFEKKFALKTMVDNYLTITIKRNSNFKKKLIFKEEWVTISKKFLFAKLFLLKNVIFI